MLLLSPQAAASSVSKVALRRPSSLSLLAASWALSSCTSATPRSTVLTSAARRRCYSSKSSDSAQDAAAPPTRPRVRFAPSPTGQLHLGGLRTALFNHLFARRWGGEWILRIEDTDRTRFVPGSQEALQSALSWAGLEYDEGPDRGGPKGPYKQSERLDLYQAYANRLLASGEAYRDFRPQKDLTASERKEGRGKTSLDLSYRPPDEDEAQRMIRDGQKFIVRYRLKPQTVEHQDLVYGELKFPKDSLAEDPVLVKSDGWPTYHLANVVDDHEMGITHVLRGEEWIPSLPLHLSLYESLGLKAPFFAHLPLLINPDGTKLSKRSGAAVSVEAYRGTGIEPEALCNFVGLMGCNWRGREGATGEEEVDEVMDLEEMQKHFSLSRVSHSRAALNLAKLDFLNKSHIARKLASSTLRPELVSRAQALLKERWAASSSNGAAVGRLEDEDWVGRVTDIFSERAKKIPDIPEAAAFLFEHPDWELKEARKMRRSIADESYATLVGATMTELRKGTTTEIGIAEAEAILERLGALVSTSSDAESDPGKLKAKVRKPLRHAMTGRQAGPALPDLMSLMHREDLLRRLEKALAFAGLQGPKA